MGHNQIVQKKIEEREAVVDDALRQSLHHLMRAHAQFSAAIPDRRLNDRFTQSLQAAQEVIAELGVEF